MTMDKKALDAVMGAVQRRAMEIVALPQNEREARYTVIHASYLEAAKRMKGGSKEAWDEMAGKMVEFTRALVGIIESGGGGGGGTA